MNILNKYFSLDQITVLKAFSNTKKHPDELIETLECFLSNHGNSVKQSDFINEGVMFMAVYEEYYDEHVTERRSLGHVLTKMRLHFASTEELSLMTLDTYLDKVSKLGVSSIKQKWYLGPKPYLALKNLLDYAKSK